MPSIGPEIPTHLLRQTAQPTGGQEADEHSIGPRESLRTAPTSPSPSRDTRIAKLNSPKQADDDSDDDGDAYGPALPPELMAARSAGPSKPSTSSTRPVGPSLPSQQRFHPTAQEESDDDDDDIGPRPLPSNVKVYEPSAVQLFMEAEEKRRKNAEEAAKPKAPKRDEWMLVPPSSSDLLGGLDPTRLTKARTFSRSTATPTKPDNSLWTETPAERQQRLADEVSGKKRRAENQVEDPDLVVERTKRRRDDEFLRKGVDDYTTRVRGPALVAQHTETLAAGPSQKEDTAIWDHGRDMGIGGRLMDDGKRNQLLREARELGDRFSAGTRGGFL